MTHARELTAAGQKVAVLFGPERAGLENDDVALADAVISVPVNPDFRAKFDVAARSGYASQ